VLLFTKPEDRCATQALAMAVHHTRANSQRKPQGRALSQAPSAAKKPPLLVLLVCLALVAITWLVYGQTIGHDFINFDDPTYVYQNPFITRGISIDGTIGAFTHIHARNWHPLTTISHMLDCQLFGLKAGGHHFTNVLLHSIAVVLLFLVFKQMTGAFWQSAFVASLFAIHPLHVESVAWISERKDVLSAVFFMLTLCAYVHYGRAPSVSRYFLVAFVFALGLMSKPMLVTLPFVLLLLDYWPLKRSCGERSLLAEKVPLIALSAVSCVATLLVQRYSPGATDQLPLAWRLNNAAVSYVAYIWQMFWPARLAAFYPHPNDELPLGQVVLAVTFLVAVSLLAIRWRKEWPYIFTGWFWYVGMLVPVIGLVQVGEQARADRYTYLPQIGLYVLIVWGFTDLVAAIMTRHSVARPVTTKLRGSRERQAASSPALAEFRRVQQSRGYKGFCAALATAIIVALSWRAFIQTSYWKNSEMLWNHALDVTNNNDTAHNNLGYFFLRRGELDSAISQFQAALEIRSRHAAAHYNIGGAVIENNLATALAQKGLIDDAISHCKNAMKLQPDYGDPYFNLGSLLFQQGRIDEAIAQWQKGAAMQPDDAGFHSALANAFLKKRLYKDAITEYEHAARIDPRDPLARSNLAWLLATSPDASIRDGTRAVKLAQQAVQLSGEKDPTYLRTLAAAYAESDRFTDAQQAARQALEAAKARGKSALADALRDEITLYELGLPLRSKPR
jgi:tetratricopeptide (TPR) repeat protein